MITTEPDFVREELAMLYPPKRRYDYLRKMMSYGRYVYRVCAQNGLQ